MAGKPLKGTKTIENLMKAFAGESQARNRYNFYEKVAREEGYKKIAEIFAETAHNEHIHAKIFFEHLIEGLEGEEFPVALNVNGDYPVGKSDTEFNLKAAAMGENEEWTILYPKFAKVADEEGFPKVAASFRMITGIEKHHDERYTELYNKVREDKIFKKDEKTMWQCMACGYIFEGAAAPEVCPVCKEPKSHFMLFCEKF